MHLARAVGDQHEGGGDQDEHHDIVDVGDEPVPSDPQR